MRIDKDALLRNYKERIRRLNLSSSLKTLEARNIKDLNNKKINMYDAGLLSLLFFFENKLIRKRDVGKKELMDFLQEIFIDLYSLDEKLLLKITDGVILSFRPASGKRISYEFFNYESEENDVVYYSILKAGKSNIESNKQYYELDEDGLELIFASKEYYGEFQLSINQMLLRKQLEKGEFISALRQIDEMQINVDSLKDRINKLKNEINRNIVSEEVYLKYKTLIEDINLRLEHESNEFIELDEFVKVAIEDRKFNIKSDVDRRIYMQAIRVKNELEKVHTLHDLLLEESIKLKTFALVAAKESLYYVGVESFNLNKELVGKAVSLPLNLDAIKAISAPFSRLHISEIWSPLAVFFPQRLYIKEDIETQSSYFELDKSDDEKDDFIEVLYYNYMKLIIDNISEDSSIKLSELIEILKKQNPQVLEYRSFYSFWMIMHQWSPFDLIEHESEQKDNIMSKALELLSYNYKSLTVIELKEILDIDDQFSISDMSLNLEGRYEI